MKESSEVNNVMLLYIKLAQLRKSEGTCPTIQLYGGIVELQSETLWGLPTDLEQFSENHEIVVLITFESDSSSLNKGSSIMLILNLLIILHWY